MCMLQIIVRPGPEVKHPFSCSSQLSMKLIELINVIRLTNVDILKFISMINTTSKGFKSRQVLIFLIYFYF